MRQKLGQHFLANPNTLEKIARLICGGAARPRVLEIGPGRGALTSKLVGCAAHVIAVELDAELVLHLREEFAAASNLEVVNADALDVDFAAWRPDVVAGNLPYYVATPLIERVVRLGLPGVFLIQKEVAVRLTAVPGSRDYGYLTVRTQLFSQVSLKFTVPPGAFRPPPKVDSAVVVLEPRDRVTEFGIDDVDAFLGFLGACFRQKRKMLRNNLRSEFAIEGQAEAGLRAEQLSLEELAGLWRRLRGR